MVKYRYTVTIDDFECDCYSVKSGGGNQRSLQDRGGDERYDQHAVHTT